MPVCKSMLFIVVVLGILFIVVIIILDANGDSRQQLLGHFPDMIRNEIYQESEYIFNAYVKRFGRLPSELSELNVIETDYWRYVGDPIENDRLLVYKICDPYHGSLYSIGFDKQDNKGEIIYDNKQDDYLINNFHWISKTVSSATEIHERDQVLENIKGDIVLKLEVVDSTNEGIKKLIILYEVPEERE